MRTVVSAICVILFLQPLLTSAGRILYFANAPFMSHQIVHRSFTLTLHKRGHELVVFTPFPLRDRTLNNYTEIDLSYMNSLIEEYNDARWDLSSLETSILSFKIINKYVAQLFQDPEFKKIYRHDSGEKFDAVIVELLNDLSLYALAYRFNAPLIGILSLGVHNYHRHIFGGPILSSHPSNWEVNSLAEINQSFWQRVENFINVWRYLYFWSNYNVIIEQKKIEEYFGNDVPNCVDIMKNASILLINDNPFVTYARPDLPNVIYFTGVHIQKTPPSLSKDLKRFLDDATEGFIYVSLGTTVSCDNLPKEIVASFFEVFPKLPYKIVWKFECDKLPKKLDNAFISKWFPQQGVLAHPNIKLFIYQGGLQSSEEALYYAVPLLGISIMAEQTNRINRLASLGVAKYLQSKSLDREHFATAIYQIINDESYKQRMTYISELYKDQPYDSLENAIWWVEYVMRHKGINHLRLSESDKPWYQRFDMDIIAFLSIMLFTAACIIIFAIFRMLRVLQRILKKKYNFYV